MDEMLERFESASGDQVLVKEPFSELDRPPSLRHLEARDKGSDSTTCVERATVSPNFETRRSSAADEVSRSNDVSNEGETPTCDAFEDDEKTLASRLCISDPTDDVVPTTSVGDEHSVKTSDAFQRGCEVAVASRDVLSSDSHCEQLPAKASDVAQSACDVGVASQDSASSDDERDELPVAAWNVSRRGCSRRVASSDDESKDAPNPSPNAAQAGLSAGAASSDDETPVERTHDPDREDTVPASNLSRRGCSDGVASSDDESKDTADASLNASRHNLEGDAALSDDEPLASSKHTDDAEEEGAKGPKAKKGQRKSFNRAMELQQIYSTSQRMTRENKMALPYHEPAKLSLRDFLNRRRSQPSPEQPQQPAECPVEEQALTPGSQSSLRLAEAEPAGTGAQSPQPNEDSRDGKEAVKMDQMPTVQQDGLVDVDATGAGAESTPGSAHLSTPLTGRRLKDVLAIAGNLTPRLSRDPVIVLGDHDSPSGVALLLDRLAKHAKTDQAKAKEQPKPNATTGSGLFEEAPVPKSGPGQLTALREQLLKKVRQERQRSRQERFQQQQFYNEEALPPGADSASLSEDPFAALGDEEEEEILSDEESASSDDNGSGDTSDEEEVVATRKKSRRVNPILEDDDDECDEGALELKTDEGQPQNDSDDSDDTRLKLDPFWGADDEEEPSASVEDGLTGALGGRGAASTASAVSSERTGKSFQSDELLVFSPLTGLSSTQRTHTASQDCLTPDLEASPATPPRSAFKEAPSLPFSPLIGVDGGCVTPLRKNLSGRFERPWDRSTSVVASQDMDELVGLCSGSFGTRNEAGDAGSQFGDTTNLVGPTRPGNDDIEDEGEDNDVEDEGEDEDERIDRDQDERIDRDQEEDEDEEAEEADVAENRVKKRLRDFFEDEAELSGSDVGSDGEEDDDDEEGVLADLIAADDGKEDSTKLREEIGRFHFKQLLDEDKRELKIYQELLLEDGDLHTDGTGRQRRFRWKNNGVEEGGEVQNSDGEHGDAQAELVVDASWQLQRLERQRWLEDQAEAEKAAEASARAARLSEKESSSHFPLARMQESWRGKKGDAEKPAVCGSFLKLGTSVLGRIADRIKSAAPAEKEGSVTTKNFVFRTSDEKPKKRVSSSQLSQGATMKKPKVEVLEEHTVQRSIFNFL